MDTYIVIGANTEDDNAYDYETYMSKFKAQSREKAIERFLKKNSTYPYVLSCEVYNPNIEEL
jgi:hypothetical protein